MSWKWFSGSFKSQVMKLISLNNILYSIGDQSMEIWFILIYAWSWSWFDGHGHDNDNDVDVGDNDDDNDSDVGDDENDWLTQHCPPVLCKVMRDRWRKSKISMSTISSSSSSSLWSSSTISSSWSSRQQGQVGEVTSRDLNLNHDIYDHRDNHDNYGHHDLWWFFAIIIFALYSLLYGGLLQK